MTISETVHSVPLASISGDTLDSLSTLSADVTLGKHTVSHSCQVIRNCFVINTQNMSFEL